MLAGRFPQPKLPVLGQTLLFSRNEDIPAASRYGRNSVDTFPVDEDLAERLGGAAGEIVAEARENKTWRVIPAERKDSSDLLIAYAEADLDAPLAATLGDELIDGVDPIAAFEKRTSEILQTVKGRIGASTASDLVQIIVLRKVDRGNQKVVLHRALTAQSLYQAATRWAAGERNTPEWLRLPLPQKKGHAVRWSRPSHLAPLRVPGLTRRLYRRGGTEVAEAVGIPASEALGLLLEDQAFRRRELRLLDRLLRLQGEPASGSAHALRKGGKHIDQFDRPAALQMLGFSGLLLHKAGRLKEDYMSDTAFRLGQFLAAADVLHAGYCADRRGGDVPPTLLGNSVLTIAQSNPARALELLCLRWKPYGAWARQTNLQTEAARLRASKKLEEQQRAWAIWRGVSQYRRAADIARSLHGTLPTAVDEIFRAELLLGYVAGLEPVAKGGEVISAGDANTNEEE